MVNLSKFKDHLLSYMRLMVATELEYVDVVYKGRLYRFHVEDLGQDVVKRRRPRHVSLVTAIKTKKCPDCGKLAINGVCTNSLCPGRKA